MTDATVFVVDTDGEIWPQDLSRYCYRPTGELAGTYAVMDRAQAERLSEQIRAKKAAQS